MQAQFLELYRAGIRSATDVMKASLEQAERLQQQQLQVIRNALEDAGRSAGQLNELKSIDDLVGFNSRMAGSQMERMAELWSSWWRAAADTQKSMIDQMQSQVGQARERVREGYAFTTRTSEDVARLAATQVSRMAGSMQESVPQPPPPQQERRPERKSA